MQKRLFTLSAVTAGIMFLTGCGGGGGSDTPTSTKTLYKLDPQETTQNYLFYGNVNPKSLGSLNNLKIIDSKAPGKPVLEADTSTISYSVCSTGFDYNQTNKQYKNLRMQKVHYVSDNKAYSFSMQDGKAIQSSSEANISNPSYTAVEYLGTRQYLTAKSGDKSILITPEMTPDDTPLSFDNKKLLTLTYPQYGSAIDGYLVYDNTAKTIQKCTLQMDGCSDILAAGSRDFEGDVPATTYSVFLTDGKLYKIDKKDGTKTEISLGDKAIKSGHGTTSFNGGDFYFIATDGNLYRCDLANDKLIKLTQQADDRLERIRAVTEGWVIAGSDTLLMGLKKDGTTQTPVTLIENTKTKGYKYITLGIGNSFLYELYSVDPKTGDTAYRACIFKDGEIQCKNDSFWAGVSAKTAGTLNTTSAYPYAPYAYIRVDETDDFGGGTLKAINPAYPFDDGIAMGKIDNYNFQTFLSNSRYLTQTIDSGGGVVLFAKNDNNFHVDAFYMNLLKENSLVQLTNNDPGAAIHQGRDHCHGRHCMICHNLAGGKIYKDKNGTKSAYGYKIRLDFEDGTQLLADISKGKGENFSMPIKKITGNFKVNVLDKNGTVINHSVNYYHEGIAYADCNYCHARDGQTRFDAPGTISITP